MLERTSRALDMIAVCYALPVLPGPFAIAALAAGTAIAADAEDTAGTALASDAEDTADAALASDAAVAATATAPGPAGVPEDPFLWLEDVESPKSMSWVRGQNAATVKRFGTGKEYTALYERLFAIITSKDQIPGVEKIGSLYYNFWQDAAHERGIWRRTTLESYRTATPQWEMVIDLDALSALEKTTWAWGGTSCLPPEHRRCLVYLSRGGSDAKEVREFDLAAKVFVDDGFRLPEAKSFVAWVDHDTVFVSTDFGAGSQTRSGYPRIVKLWKRNTPLSAAQTVFEASADDLGGAFAGKDFYEGHEKEFVVRYVSWFDAAYFVRLGGRLVKLDVPADAQASTHGPHLFVTLRSAWTVGGKTYPAGALLTVGFDAFLRGGREFTVLFEPTPTTSLSGMAPLRDGVLLTVLDTVRSRLVLWEFARGVWTNRPVEAGSRYGSVQAWAVDGLESNDYWLTATDFITPTTLFLGGAQRAKPDALKSEPAHFKADGLSIEQHMAVSKDGTKVPYFEVGPKDAPKDGSRPTLLYGYGGFEVSMTPSYSATIGAAWLARGNVFVLANIRGGGEFGPAWHKAALREKRQASYDDFIAIAEDLVRRKVTSPARLGIMGGSNGGLLVANAMIQRPDLFGAVVCQVPLLDMKRYTKLLAGASWITEYGDPDVPEDWAFLARYSPYQLLKKGTRYPAVLFTTTTRDDRVHPGHARKMTARMQALGVPNVFLYENTEGGHGAGVTPKQKAAQSAVEMLFLRAVLGTK